ncbi:ATP-dependent zinc metalloprotease FtsH 4 [Bremerella volcania]|uniref:Uncharacterized AAA domain-containing protein ycf46 n=1 Tax=Bremerella volcania TaxID=2527984 RepID=A0A518C3E8_9BACT|nr:AAA family ATPase [Bremerella volcania]QDU73743.1 ATP-dependent zinc metalloprotease FtsH 4 [Bremerella volcania]
MSLTEQLSEHVEACFTGIWLQSHEPDEVLTEIGRLCRQQDWRLSTWNINQGIRGTEAGSGIVATDPLGVIQAIPSLAVPGGTSIVVLSNFHFFVRGAEVVQALSDQVLLGKRDRTFVIILSPVCEIPVELEKMFVQIEHSLPQRDQLAEIAREVAVEEGELPESEAFEEVLDAASGLTCYQAESAFSLSIVQEGRLTPETLWAQKGRELKKLAGLSLHRGQEDFNSLGGLDALKRFTKRILEQADRGDPLRQPRGVLLLSPPGAGKSQFCRCLGRETNRPTLILDIGSLFGSLLGETERRIRQALQAIDAMGPSVVMLDEIEKSFSGVGGNGQSDSGVAARAFGTFLTWMNDRSSNSFVVCTSNSIERLPPEFARSERFDAVFFVDLPNREEKDRIWQLYKEMFQIDGDQPLPDDRDWTGAEIKSACRLACLLRVSLSEAAQYVVPVAKTSAESIRKLREFASGRCLSASQDGIYHFEESSPRRRSANPQLN